jgi:hypothetical protein
VARCVRKLTARETGDILGDLGIREGITGEHRQPGGEPPGYLQFDAAAVALTDLPVESPRIRFRMLALPMRKPAAVMLRRLPATSALTPPSNELFSASAGARPSSRYCPGVGGSPPRLTVE